MKKLSHEQIIFLKSELGITNINYNDDNELKNIRLKCLDIETEEVMKQLNLGVDETSIGWRGDMAVSIIDDLYDIMTA